MKNALSVLRSPLNGPPQKMRPSLPNLDGDCQHRSRRVELLELTALKCGCGRQRRAWRIDDDFVVLEDPALAKSDTSSDAPSSNTTDHPQDSFVTPDSQKSTATPPPEYPDAHSDLLPLSVTYKGAASRCVINGPFSS